MESAQLQPNLATDIRVMEVMVTMGDTEAMDMASAQLQLSLATDITVTEVMVTMGDTEAMDMASAQLQPNLAMVIMVMEVMDMARGMPMPHLTGVKQFRPNYFSH